MEARITSTARKHRLSSSRIREALAVATFLEMDGDMALYVGTDAPGPGDRVRDRRRRPRQRLRRGARDAERMEEQMTGKRPARFPESFGPDVTVRDIDLAAEEFYVGGERLTEDRAAELAARAERRSSGGRPSLGAPGTHSPMLNVRVSEDTKSELVALAEASGRRQSDLVREAIDEYLQRRRGLAS